MTLIKYNPETLRKIPTDAPALKIHRTDAFCLNWKLVEITGFAAGEKVSIANQVSKEGMHEHSEWFLVKDADGYELKQKLNRKHMTFHCNKLARLVLDKNDLPDKCYSFRIANKLTILEDGTKGWCLIISSTKNINP